MKDIKKFLELLLNFISENKFSDLHLTSGQNVVFRNKIGDLEKLEKIGENEIGILETEEIIQIIKFIIGEENFDIFLEQKEVDISYKIDSEVRFRVNCYINSDGFSVAFRLITSEIPSLEELGFSEKIKEMLSKQKGLILVTGPTGSGKSTNLASMIDYINKNFKKHIITIEDPIEFSFKNKESLIHQREIGAHTNSFEKAMKSALREDPDVIMVGEARDLETIKTAISLAETGHLVLTSLHTNDSVQTIDRIVDIFPTNQQPQIRMQLSQSLIGIISQELLPRADGKGRVAAREILLTNDAIKNLIISGKTHQFYSILEIGQKEGMILKDKYLIALYAKKLITKETLFSFARSKENIEMMIS